MNIVKFNNLDCVIIMKKYGYSDADLLNLLDIPESALESGNLSEKAFKNLNLLQTILTKEGIEVG